LRKLSEIFQADLIYIPKKRDVIIFIIPIVIYILYLLNILPYFYHRLDNNIFIALYSATIGYKYIEPYISKVKNKRENIFLVALYILLLSLFFRIPGFLIAGRDPQGLSGITTDFRNFIYIGFFKYIFVGIGEELFNFYILLTLISFIKGKHRFIVSILITSTIFGLLHGIYWPILSVFPIGFGHIPYIYSYGKYKSLLPAMFAHSLMDILSTLYSIPGIENLLTFFIQITFFIFIVKHWNKARAL